MISPRGQPGNEQVAWNPAQDGADVHQRVGERILIPI